MGLTDPPDSISTSATVPEAQTASKSPQKNGTDIHEACARLPLTPDLWKSLGLDEYLRAYPMGNNLTLEVIILPILRGSTRHGYTHLESLNHRHLFTLFKTDVNCCLCAY